MKIISWNVNGIRAILKKNFMEFVRDEKPDILCIQETKAHQEQVDLNVPDYRQYWNSADRKGYSGTLVLSKEKPLSVKYDMPGHEDEGRIITVEFDDFYLVNVYVPNAQRGLARIEYRQKWDTDFAEYLSGFDKPVVVCGDFNVAHNEIDLARPKENVGNAGFSDEERQGFTNILDEGFVDIWRVSNPEKVKYTWWAYMFNARAKGIGWRIDYFIVSKSFVKVVDSVDILDQVLGSDHCPVKLILQKPK